MKKTNRELEEKNEVRKLWMICFFQVFHYGQMLGRATWKKTNISVALLGGQTIIGWLSGLSVGRPLTYPILLFFFVCGIKLLNLEEFGSH